MLKIKENLSIITFVLIGIIVIICLTGCQKSQTSDFDPNKVSLKYTIDDALTRFPETGDQTRTTTLTTAAERQITETVLLFYSNSAFVGAVPVLGNSNDSEGRFEITLPQGMSPASEHPGDYNVIVLCNFFNYTNPKNTATLKYIDDNISSLTYQQAINAIEFTAHKPIVSPLPMHALATFNIPVDILEDLVLEVVLERAISRIDVYNYASNFVFKKAKICNYRKFIKPFSVIGLDTAVEGSLVLGEYIDASTEVIMGGLYCFPNSVEIPRQADANTTYLMVNGRYQGALEDTYYRVNIVNDNMVTEYSQSLEENKRYQVSFFKVPANGATVVGDVETNAVKIKTSLLDETVENTSTDLSGNYISSTATRIVLGNSGTWTDISISVNPLKSLRIASDSGGFYTAALTLDQSDSSKGVIRITATDNPGATVSEGVIRIEQVPDIANLFLNINVIQ